MVRSVQQTYDAHASDYDKIYGESVAPYFQLCNAMIWRTLMRTVAPLVRSLGRRPLVLDGGGGTGLWAKPLQDAGCDVIVLDLSRQMLMEARERRALDPVQANLLKIPFIDHAFDVMILQGDPLSYCLDDHEPALREVARVVRPGGALIGSADNAQFAALSELSAGTPLSRVETSWRSRLAHDPYGAPTYLFGTTELREKIERAGFEVDSLRSVPSIPLSFTADAVNGFNAAWQRIRSEPGGTERLLALLDEITDAGGLEAAGVHFQFIGRKTTT